MSDEDLDAVLRVERASYEAPWAPGIFAAELQNDFSTVLVVEDHNTIIGHIVFWLVHDELHLLNVAIHPQYRRRGLGSALLTGLLQICRESRLVYLTLEVRVSNQSARRLYERYGLRQIGRRKRYYPDNQEDAIVMAIVLDETGAPVEDAV